MNDLIEQLTDLFERLRKAGVELGVAKYMLLLQALREGFGLSDREALCRLCRLIWLPSLEQAALFDHHFQAAVTVSLPIELAPAQDQVPAPAPTDATPQTGDQATAKQPLKPKLMPLPLDEIKQDKLSYEVVESIRMAVQTEDVISHARTIRVASGQAGEPVGPAYPLTAEFLPVSIRAMKQNWRYLRRMVRSGPPVELDLEATIRQVGRTRFMVQPVLRPRRVNRSALLLLLDQKGSMVPFHFLARRVAETATASGCFGKAGVYYFHNCPPRPPDAPPPDRANPYAEHLLYAKPQCLEPQPVSALMDEFAYAHADVLIFSDAGAARGGWNEQRIQATALFLYQLATRGIEQLVWLNPMPRDRWRETSAEAIARFVPMFSIDAQGMEDTIRALRSQTCYSLTF